MDLVFDILIIWIVAIYVLVGINFYYGGWLKRAKTGWNCLLYLFFLPVCIVGTLLGFINKITGSIWIK
ncbi:hypothetical protein KUA24_99 [Vibrio phage HNL01]|nr:hypothetical protein KUA24_99 [Vibrio phage HNL01]